MTRTLALLFLALALVLSGCVGIGTDAEPTSAGAPDGDPPRQGGGESGTTARPGPTETETGVDPSGQPTPELEVVDVSWDGRSRVLVCLPRGVDECAGPALNNDDRERFTPELDGTPIAFQLTMTWTPESELTEEMALHAIGLDGCEHECTVTGTSPLTFTMDDVMLVEGEALVLHAFAPEPCWEPCSGIKAFVDPGQDVHVEGTTTVLLDENSDDEAADGYDP